MRVRVVTLHLGPVPYRAAALADDELHLARALEVQRATARGVATELEAQPNSAGDPRSRSIRAPPDAAFETAARVAIGAARALPGRSCVRRPGPDDPRCSAPRAAGAVARHGNRDLMQTRSAAC